MSLDRSEQSRGNPVQHGLKLEIQEFSTQKRGNSEQEYEDYCHYSYETNRLAISDGASEAFEARIWSRLLAEAFVQDPPEPNADAIMRWLRPQGVAWRQYFEGRELPYYIENKLRQGSYATLLGMVFSLRADTTSALAPDTTSGRWSALAVGDACVFQVRADKVIMNFPIENSADFGTTPALLYTRPDFSLKSLKKLKVAEGECLAGDLFVLATDALAEWFLRLTQEGEQPWRLLTSVTPKEFPALVEHLRKDARMRNDDVTLMLTRITSIEQAPAERVMDQVVEPEKGQSGTKIETSTGKEALTPPPPITARLSKQVPTPSTPEQRRARGSRIERILEWLHIPNSKNSKP